METTAVFAGTFDPFTTGHYEIVARAKACFDRIVVAVATDTGKRTTASDKQRLALAAKAVGSLPGVQVQDFSGLLTDFVATCNTNVLVRGLRNATDFAYERDLLAVYRSQKPDIEAVYFMTDGACAHVSGSTVRQLAALGGDLSAYVPASILRDVIKIYR